MSLLIEKAQCQTGLSSSSSVASWVMALSWCTSDFCGPNVIVTKSALCNSLLSCFNFLPFSVNVMSRGRIDLVRFSSCFCVFDQNSHQWMMIKIN